MSNNNNKQPLDLTESLLVFDKAQAPSTTRVQSGEASTTTPIVNELDYEGISLVERRSRDVKPREKNDSLGISGINQPDVTTSNLSHSDELTIGFLLDCAERGENRDNQPSPSICKVSRILRDLDESSFNPQLVSIGPIHREDPKLKEFEWMKECYLNHLLRRCESTQRETLETCMLKVHTLIPQIRESYAGVKKIYSDVDLSRMVVMDGCYILEFCFKHADDENMYLQMQNLRIAMDLMLLENQVPFFVLQALFDCFMGKQSFTLSYVLDEYLAPYIQLFRPDLLPKKKSIPSIVLDKFLALYIKPFRSPLPEEDPTTEVDSSTHDHVLGYLHKRYQPSNPIHTEASKLAYHSIVDLDSSGINFKPHQGDNLSMTIKFQPPLFRCLPWFWSKPALLMPILIISDFTEVILRNFLAYEQSFPKGRNFTSYVHAMDMLIDTQEDIAKLVESDVLINNLCSNREAADMINKIGKNNFVTDFLYTEEFIYMDEYYNRFWPKIKRTYFTNPWNVINLLAGTIVFIATVVGVIFAVLEYFR